MKAIYLTIPLKVLADFMNSLEGGGGMFQEEDKNEVEMPIEETTEVDKEARIAELNNKTDLTEEEVDELKALLDEDNQP